MIYDTKDDSSLVLPWHQAMDIAGFHERMQDKYAERERRQRRYDRLVRILVLSSMALIASSLAFVLVYLWYTGRL